VRAIEFLMVQLQVGIDLNSELRKIGMVNIEYLTNQDGEAIGVVIPIDLWRQLLPTGEVSEENLAEAVEDYCLNKAMNEAANTALLGRAEALAYLEE
jgi:hypothetical protein